MKLSFLSIILFFSFCAVAQTMTAEEKDLRQSADMSSFLAEVKKNKTANCLCKPNEYVVFSFSTKANKTASLCVSKKLSTTTGYLVYRFGTKAKTELSFPSDTLNSFSQFSYAYYSRGGGKQNAAMTLNHFRFTNAGFTYMLFDDWHSEDGQFAKGVEVTNNKTGKTIYFPARGKAIGDLTVFANSKIVTESDEL